MKRTDFYWIGCILLITFLFLSPWTKESLALLTANHPYLMGFLKTAILASLGEALARRIESGFYFKKPGNLLRFFVWGILGMGFVLFFVVFAQGIEAAVDKSLLPGIEQVSFWQTLLMAFLISTAMNVIFAPTFMYAHRLTDALIDQIQGKWKNRSRLSLKKAIESIDMHKFVVFVIGKTIPFFWIPAHTITFLLVPNFRVLMAGYLSIALGLILTLSKRSKKKESTTM